MSYGGFEYNQSNQPAAGGFGGFDAMSGGGGFMDSGGAAKQDSGKKPRGDRSIIPLTIKQVHEASNSPEGGFFIDNAQVNQVRVMGIIENMDDLSTAVNYQVNDGTGTCECKFWKDNDDGSNKHASIRQFDYVRIEGQLRDYEGKKHVLVYAMKKVEDWNEMTHHFLDTIYVHLQNTKGPVPGSTNAMAGVSAGFGTPSHNTFMQPSFGGGGGQSLQLNDGGNDVKRKLWDTFKKLDAGSDEGVNVEYAFAELGKEGISRGDMKAALTALADDGNVYSTIDEEHYKSTE